VSEGESGAHGVEFFFFSASQKSYFIEGSERESS